MPTRWRDSAERWRGWRGIERRRPRSAPGRRRSARASASIARPRHESCGVTEKRPRLKTASPMPASAAAFEWGDDDLVAARSGRFRHDSCRPRRACSTMSPSLACLRQAAYTVMRRRYFGDAAAARGRWCGRRRNAARQRSSRASAVSRALRHSVPGASDGARARLSAPPSVLIASRWRIGVPDQRGGVFEGPLHHDEPGHFQHRIDVGLLEESLRDADIDAVDDRSGSPDGTMPELP